LVALAILDDAARLLLGRSRVSQHSERCHVVVADAERLTRWYLAQLAQDVGWLVTEVQNIEMALTHLHESKERADLMFLDCPRTYADLAGVTAIKQARPTCHIVLTMTFRVEAFVGRARALGVDQVLVKPIDAADVRRLLEEISHGNRLEHEPSAFRFEMQKALRREREHMRGQLAQGASEQGHLGDAAREVERILREHALREENFALPPLGLLPMLAIGLVWSEMRPAVSMAANLKADLPQMLEDHEAVVTALQALEHLAWQAGRLDLTLLAQRLMQHLEIETEVLYPAAIVAGQFLESQLTRRSDSGS
jgi:DNA-binding NarL/FixJ family response regulator